MGKRDVYQITQAPSETQTQKFFCVKIDSATGLEEGSYELERSHGRVSCSCFAGKKETCRHREMLEIFIDEGLEAGLIGRDRLYHYDKKRWYHKDDKGYIVAV